MELSCILEGMNEDGKELNANAEEFEPRPNAAEVANVRIKDQAEYENDEE